MNTIEMLAKIKPGQTAASASFHIRKDTLNGAIRFVGANEGCVVELTASFLCECGWEIEESYVDFQTAFEALESGTSVKSPTGQVYRKLYNDSVFSADAIRQNKWVILAE